MSSLPGKTLYASGFDPRTIPGCALWLDAADRNTLTLSGSNITQWNDKSGYGFNAVPVSGNTIVFKSPGQNNLPVCNFGNNRMNISNFNWRTKFTVALVTQANAGTFLYSLWGSNYINYVYGGNWNLVFLNTSLALNDSTIAQGTTATGSAFCIAIYQYGLMGTPPTWRLNGTQRSTVYVSGSYPSDVSLSGTLFINGNGSNNIDTSQIAEIIHYNDNLTASQCQQLEGYLASKWGLLGNIPATHPFKNYPVFTRLFQPVDISSCSLWLDSLDVCGNGSNPAPGTALSVWADKSGNGYNLSQTVASNQPTFTASGISFNGTSSWMTRANPNIRPLITYVVVKPNVLDVTRTIIKIGTSGTNFEYDMRYGGTGVRAVYINSLQASGICGLTGTTDMHMLTSTWDGSKVNFYKDGGSQFSSADLSGTQQVGVHLYSLGSRNGTATELMSGNIYEVIHYDQSPSDIERQQVESYLANKWNLKSLLPSTHAFKLYDAVTPVFTPVQVPGCVMWLDATDSTKITLSGTNVTTWTDKSGNGNNATTGGTIAPSLTKAGINGLDVLEFGLSNTEMVSQDLYGNRSFAMFAITRRQRSYTTGTVTAWLAGLDQVNNSNCIFGYSGNSFVKFGFFGNDINVAIPTYVSQSTEPAYILGFYYTPGTRQVWANGSLLGSDTNSTNLLTSSRMRIGRFLQSYWRGQIGEIIAYNGVLNPSQREVIEAYFAHKWGLVSSLPASHPYRKIRP